jgi:hypothetical protein
MYAANASSDGHPEESKAALMSARVRDERPS